MEAMTANHTVPAVCRVMCTLLTAGISGIQVTNSAVPAINQASPQHHPVSLPEGYVAYPDVGFAYKVHDEIVTWIEARKRCIEEGAQLARIDSIKKVEYVKRQKHTRDWAFVGILRLYDRTTWVAISTGLPVTALPWTNSFPHGEGDCVLADFAENGLGNHFCVHEHNYVCELPIFEQDAPPAN